MVKKLAMSLCLLGAVAAGAQSTSYIDLGLSVLWSAENSGISDERPVGEYLTWIDAARRYTADNAEGRLATKAEWDELLDLCSWKWTSVDGNQGYLVTSKVKGFTDRSIFLPAAGWLQDGRLEQVSTYASYWSATEGVQPGNSAAYGFNFQRGHTEWHSENRYSEQSVRLVRPLDDNQIKRISFERNRLVMRQGTSERIAVSMSRGKRNVNSACAWTSSDNEVVSVSADGLIVAHNPGNCTITATAYGNSAACRVTVTADEYDYVDLGLSVLWATRNLGARDSSDYGNYYAWAEVEPKDFFSWGNYRYCSFAGQPNGLDKYVMDGMAHQYLPADNLSRILPEDDAATLLLGSDWHIPTVAEFTELEDNCMIRDTVTADGKPGALIISEVPGYEGRSMFIPFGGKYTGNDPIGVGEEFQLWEADTEGNNGGYRIADKYKTMERDRHFRYSEDRFFGMNIRPVRGMTEKEFSSLGIQGSLTDMSYGEVRQVALQMEPSGRPILSDNIVWSASDESMVRAMPDGTVIALATGECTLTAQYQGKSITVPVSVTMPVPEPVDLGLSVKWASANLGAAKPEDDGGLFAWGETSVKCRPYSRGNYKFQLSSGSGSFTKYDFGERYENNGHLDFKEQLDPEDDAAHVLLGGQWRMPTAAECDELLRNCTWTRIDEENRKGWLVSSNVPGYEGNAIYLPYTDVADNFMFMESVIFRQGIVRDHFIYRSSTMNVSMGIGTSWNWNRFEGQAIRPVQELPDEDRKARQAEILQRNSRPAAGNVRHDYVDLGLSVKWATMNVGANRPEESGDSFAWGETATKPYYSLYNYSLASFHEDLGYWNYDNAPDRVLEPDQDVAHVNWGGDWRLPTKYEYLELVNECEWTDTLQNGVRGFLVTSKVAGYEGNSIFLPFRQSVFSDNTEECYMSSSSSSQTYADGQAEAVVLFLSHYVVGTSDEFGSDFVEMSKIHMSKIHISQRQPCDGFLVRPVR